MYHKGDDMLIFIVFILALSIAMKGFCMSLGRDISTLWRQTMSESEIIIDTDIDFKTIEYSKTNRRIRCERE
jgi:hypothetical protein